MGTGGQIAKKKNVAILYNDDDADLIELTSIIIIINT